MSDQYPNTIAVQFRNSGDLGTLDELEWRHEQETRIEALLKANDIGICDGGQSGAGTMELLDIRNIGVL